MNMKKLIVLSLIICLSASVAGAAIVKGPYMIYRNNNTQMQVLWQLNATQTCTLEWGLNTSYSSGSVQSTQINADHRHKKTITGLTPGTKYYYKVTAGGASATGSFRTAPATSATNVKFFAYGDTRTNPGSHNTVAGGMISKYQSDSALQTMCLLSGDWTSDDSESAWTSQFFPRNQANLMKFQSEVPIMGCIGNHEKTAAGYRKYYPYPFVANHYFSFDYGPAHICIVDTHQAGGVAAGTPQHTWLKNDLASTSKQWKFIVLHTPGWGAGTHSLSVAVQNHIQPLCKTYGVDFVIAGHNHNYARATVNGVHHITTGGGGAPLYSVNLSWPYVVTATRTLNFCTIDIQGNNLYFKAFKPNGTQIDSVTVAHGGGSPPGEASSPNPSNQATGVSTTAELSWTAGSGATSHDVYFGTASPGAFQGNQAGTTFTPGTMSTDTTYYWRVDEKNTYGTTTGPVWSFTTAGTGTSVQSNPSDDALVNHNLPTTNYGSDNYLAVRGDGTGKGRNSFLKFTVSGVSGTVTAAKLKMYSQNVTQSVTAKAVSNTSWTEGAITWSNMPSIGSTLDTKTPSASSWVEFDVSGSVTGNGTYSFCLQGSNDDTGESFTSKEGTNKPVLDVTYEGGDTNAPSAPTGLGATAGDEQVVLDWDDNSEEDLSYYNVYRDTSSGGPYTLIDSNITVSTYTDIGLTNSTTYYYVVTAVDTSDNNSLYSSEASATPVGDTTPPAAPTGLGATAGDTQVSLDWNNNSEGDFSHYNVYRDTSTGGPYTLIASALTTSAYIDTGLTNSTTYYYVVTAVDDANNESSDSSEASATPVGDTTAPAAPTGLGATAGDTQVILDWNDNAETDLDYYVVYRDTSSGGPYTEVASGLTTSFYADTGLTNDTTYYYVVTAVDTNSNESADSSEASATPVGDTTAPSAPTGLGATAGNAQVTLDWNDNGESDLASYSVYRDTSTGGPYSLIATDVQASAYTDTGLTNDTTYYYVVTAVDTSDNNSVYSSEASATPVASGGTAESNPTDDALVNHNLPTNNYGSESYLAVRGDGTGKGRNSFLKFTVTGVTGTVTSAKLKMYSENVTQTVYAKAVSDTSWTEGGITWNNQPTIGSTLDTKTPSASSWVEFDVTSHVTGNGTYSICLQGSNDGTGHTFESKEGGSNDPVLEVTYGDTGDTTPPAAPANLTAVGGNQKILLNWDDNTEQDLASYSVYRSTTSGSYGSPIATGVTTSDYNDSGLSNGTTYYYVVTAIDTSDNNSVYSSEAEATTEGVVKSIDFGPTDDALVNHNSPTLNYGTAAFLAVRGDGTSKGRNTYLKFTVTDVNGTVTSALLKMYSENVTQTVTAKAVSNTSWTEGGITWNNQPAIGSTLDTITPTAGIWVEFDVTSHVTGNGTYSICLQGSNNNTGHSFTSKEGTPAANAPVLEITYIE